jgi:hypothetical protein
MPKSPGNFDAVTEVPALELWRTTPDVDVKAVLRRLTPWEKFGLLSGVEWEVKNLTAMHDLLVTDLTLRAAELVPTIGAVYGEKLSGANKLTGLPARTTGLAHGDAVWARSDGLRIVVELSNATYKQGFAKVERWARILEADRDRDLFVIFVVAAHPRRKSRSLGWAVNAYRKAVEEAAWSSVSGVGARLAERMGVVSMADWAPAPMELSPGFSKLPVWRPTGPRGERFERADLADPSQVVFEPLDKRSAIAPICWAPLSYAMPWWLAEEAVPFARAYLPPAWQVGLPIGAA